MLHRISSKQNSMLSHQNSPQKQSEMKLTQQRLLIESHAQETLLMKLKQKTSSTSFTASKTKAYLNSRLISALFSYTRPLFTFLRLENLGIFLLSKLCILQLYFKKGIHFIHLFLFAWNEVCLVVQSGVFWGWKLSHLYIGK